jgi:hypothetical protein
MSATEEHPAVQEPEQSSAPEPVLSRAARRSGRRRARVFAVGSLAVALVTTAVLLGSAAQPEPRSPMTTATAEAWEATGALSDALRALRRGGSRNPARALVKPAAETVDRTGRRVGALDLPVAATPLRGRVLRTLRADAAWIDAVGSTLANPRSSRRADLSALASRAANATALIEDEIDAARGSVGGTGRLLSATKAA